MTLSGSFGHPPDENLGGQEAVGEQHDHNPQQSQASPAGAGAQPAAYLNAARTQHTIPSSC